MSRRQWKRWVSDYATEFWTISADSGWNKAGILDAYVHGLSPGIKDQLMSIDLPDELDAWISLSIKIDKS